MRLGGRVVRRHEGLFSPFEVDLSGSAAGTLLEILVFPAPKFAGAPADRSQARHVQCKPAVSYGWDWHPRLIPVGLWAQAQFVARPRWNLGRVDFAYVLSEDLSRAEITVTAEAAGGFRWKLVGRDGTVAIESAASKAVLERPKLWWTHDHGDPVLYTLEVEGEGGDLLRRRVGFRRVRRVMAEGSWNQPLPWASPKSRSAPPVTIELYGRVIFAKGSNWVNPDVFPG